MSENRWFVLCGRCIAFNTSRSRTKSCPLLGEHKGIRSSRYDVFECSSSFPANLLRTSKVASNQDVFQHPTLPLVTDIRCFFPLVLRENNFFGRFGSVHLPLTKSSIRLQRRNLAISYYYNIVYKTKN
ncbi:hypothetical protein AVEN_252420-1 [Araneus ventricosus]|uniref:Uncharacterized protein n=1 Tax=Araneus ventricosus TaxID=182803 RepID=A0A4Y2ASY8_ARAVE|nr:hypothetical protein AVEN_252420-1 [Araneus ventricosus]